MSRSIRWAVLVAFAVRLGALLYLGDPLGIHHAPTTWDWGYEQAAVGRALARGDGFADAFGRDSGPTGWAAPAYPLIFAAFTRLFGGAGEPMAWALALFQALVSALTCAALAALARGLGRSELARPAAWIWAFYPPAIWYSVTLLWDSPLVAFGVCVWLAALTRAGRSPRPARAFKLGLGLGLLALVNPAPLAFAPAAAPWLRFSWRRIGALGLGTVLVLLPWVARNHYAVGRAGLRTNFWVELRVGNNDLAEGRFVGGLHPAYGPEEIRRYDSMGEAAYVAWAGEQARSWIASHPARFLALCGTRLRRFWIGLGPFEEQRDWMGWIEWGVTLSSGILALCALFAWRGAPGTGWLVRGVLLLFPLVYTVTHVLPRYRFPIDGVIVLAALAVLGRAGSCVAGGEEAQVAS